MKEYRDIKDWFEMDYNLKDSRLKDLSFIFNVITKKLKRELKKYGARYVSKEGMIKAFELYHKGIDFSTYSKLETDAKIILDKLKEGYAIFSMTFEYRHFPTYDFCFYLVEDSKLHKVFTKFQNYGGGESGIPEMIHFLTNLQYDVEGMEDEDYIVQKLQERINMLNEIKKNSDKLQSINYKVEQVFSSYRKTITENLQSKRKKLYIDEYEKYEKNLRKGLDSLAMRHNFVNHIVNTQNYN